MAVLSGTKVVVLMVVVLHSLLLLQTSSVQAVDIEFYNDDGCNGDVASGCYDVGANVCCATNSAGGVKIVNLLNGESANICTGGGCTTSVVNPAGPLSGECYYNVAFSGAYWYFN